MKDDLFDKIIDTIKETSKTKHPKKIRMTTDCAWDLFKVAPSHFSGKLMDAINKDGIIAFEKNGFYGLKFKIDNSIKGLFVVE